MEKEQLTMERIKKTVSHRAKHHLINMFRCLYVSPLILLLFFISLRGLRDGGLATRWYFAASVFLLALLLFLLVEQFVCYLIMKKKSGNGDVVVVKATVASFRRNYARSRYDPHFWYVVYSNGSEHLLHKKEPMPQYQEEFYLVCLSGNPDTVLFTYPTVQYEYAENELN